MKELPRGNLRAELRGDGAHLIWEYSATAKQNFCHPDERHEIILRDVVTDATFSRGSLARVRAYCAAILTEGAVDRKKLQKKWESKIESGVLPENVDDETVELVCDSVRQAFQEKADAELRWLRDDLRNSVLRAHNKLPQDECRVIIEEAIVESVMKQ